MKLLFASALFAVSLGCCGVLCDIFAIGDIHGDLHQLREALLLTGVVEHVPGRRFLQWKNSAEGHHHIVLTGDLIDRGPEDVEVLQEVHSLRMQAEKVCQGIQGCGLIPLLGNHEAMNLADDFRYIHKCFMQATLAPHNKQHEVEQHCTTNEGMSRKLVMQRDILPIIYNWHLVAKLDTPLGSTVFTHGGVEPEMAQVGIDTINRYTPSGLLSGFFSPHDPLKAKIYGSGGPLWSRLYTETLKGNTVAACATLQSALSLMGATRMVVGHSIQPDITATCGGSLIFIDIGLSKWISLSKRRNGRINLSYPQVKILHIDNQGRAWKRSAIGDTALHNPARATPLTVQHGEPSEYDWLLAHATPAKRKHNEVYKQ